MTAEPNPLLLLAEYLEAGNAYEGRFALLSEQWQQPTPEAQEAAEAAYDQYERLGPALHALDPSAVRALAAQHERMKAALNQIACWDDPAPRLILLDEPNAARIARAALAGEGQP